MSWLTGRPDIVRLVQIRLERSPQRLYAEVNRVLTRGSTVVAGGGMLADVNAIPSVDPMEMLRALSSATAGQVTADDFVPVAVARVFELLLEVRMTPSVSPSLCGRC